MKVRVYLATTRGPVQIVRITSEQANQSVVCLHNTSNVLRPLSDHYHDFVRQPSGVIMRELGPFDGSAFRLDLSSEVGQGDSWQLAVFVAHALAAKGVLATPDDDCDAAMWLTGEVGNDLNVGAVTHISDKLKASRSEFDSMAEDKIPVTIVLPHGNRGDGANGVNPVYVTSAREAAAIAFGATPEAAAQSVSLAANAGRAAPPVHGPKPRRTAPIVLGVVVLLAVAAALSYAGYSQGWFRALDEPGVAGADEPETVDTGEAGCVDAGGPDAADTQDVPGAVDTVVAIDPGNAGGPVARDPVPEAPGEIDVLVSARRPPAGETCAAVLFGNADAVLTPLARGGSGSVVTAMRDDLCGLDFAIIASGGVVFAAAELRSISGHFLDETPLPAALGGGEPVQGRAAWRVALPRHLRGPVEYTLVVATGAEPVDGIIGWLFQQPDRAAAEANLARRGITIITINHKVTPL